MCQYLQHNDLEPRDKFSCEDDNILILFGNVTGLGSHVAKKKKKSYLFQPSQKTKFDDEPFTLTERILHHRKSFGDLKNDSFYIVYRNNLQVMIER